MVDTRPEGRAQPAFPGALRLPLEEFFPGRSDLEPGARSRMEERLAEAGLSKGFVIVAVDLGQDGGFQRAAAACWALNLAGLKECSILEGGLAAWTAAGLSPAEGGALELTPAAPLRIPERPAAFASFADTRRLVLEWNGALVDVRPGPVERPIPGAFSLTLPAVLSREGKVDRGALERLAASLGLHSEPELVVLGQGPLDGAAGWFLLSRVMGLGSARLFPGGFDRWEKEPLLPGAGNAPSGEKAQGSAGNHPPLPGTAPPAGH